MSPSRRLGLCMIAAGAVLLSTSTLPWAMRATAVSTTCGPLVASPVVPPADPAFHRQLTQVAALSASDVWAAGVNGAHSVIEHWDGNAWSVAAVPALEGIDNLVSLSADAPDDVWAVGVWQPQAAQQALMEHWDGHRWAVLAGAPLPDHFSRFEGVAAIAPNDVWVIGTGDQTPSIAEHWDGHRWSVVPMPHTQANLEGWYDVSIAGAPGKGQPSRDVWAIGRTFNNAESRPTQIAMHWDGTSWSLEPITVPAGGDITAVTAVPGTTPLGLPVDALRQGTQFWAVGGVQAQPGSGSTLVERWDGKAWSIVQSPSATGWNWLFSVSGRAGVLPAGPGSGDIWAVGVSYDGQRNHALVLHWDGLTWSVVAGPDPGDGGLLGVSASPNGPWAVGYYNDAAQTQHLYAETASCPAGTLPLG